MGEFILPNNHKPFIKVAKGGSSCANCVFLSEDKRHCTNKYFIKWYEKSLLPKDIDSWCSDYYEPNPDYLKNGGVVTASAPYYFRKEKKKQHTQLLANSIQGLRSQITRDLKNEDEKIRLTSLVVAVIDKTAERVGNETSEDAGHFGVTGLRKKHITIENNTVTLKYKGKSGVEHEKSFTDKIIAESLATAIKNTPRRSIFVSSDGFRIRADKVNRYLSQHGVTAKDLRGYHANKYIIDKLKKQDIPEIEKQRKTLFKNAVRYSAARVGHKPLTLQKHYLISQVETMYVVEGKFIDLTDMENNIDSTSSNGKNGGILQGKAHDKGGIKAIVTDINRPVELETGEVIINAASISDDTKYVAVGTPSEIASAINEVGGGVSFDEGAQITPLNLPQGETDTLAKGGVLTDEQKIKNRIKNYTRLINEGEDILKYTSENNTNTYRGTFYSPNELRRIENNIPTWKDGLKEAEGERLANGGEISPNNTYIGKFYSPILRCIENNIPICEGELKEAGGKLSVKEIDTIRNEGWKNLKEKLGEKKATKYFEQVDRLFPPYQNEIVEYRGNGVVLKENDKYTFVALADTDMKTWRTSFRVDVTEQFAQGGEVSPNKEVKVNKTLAIKEVLPRYNLDEREAMALYNLKNSLTENGSEGERGRIVYEIKNFKKDELSGAKREVYDFLENDSYIEYFGNGDFAVTTKGMDFIKAVDQRIQTRRDVKEGTDLFPENAAIPEYDAYKLSPRAEAIYVKSLYVYNIANNIEKEKNVAHVKKMIKENKHGIETIGMGFDEDMVSAGEKFLKTIEKEPAKMETIKPAWKDTFEEYMFFHSVTPERTRLARITHTTQVKEAIKKHKYANAVLSSEMTAHRALLIIQSAELPIPSEISNLAAAENHERAEANGKKLAELEKETVIRVKEITKVFSKQDVIETIEGLKIRAETAKGKERSDIENTVNGLEIELETMPDQMSRGGYVIYKDGNVIDEIYN